MSYLNIKATQHAIQANEKFVEQRQQKELRRNYQGNVYIGARQANYVLMKEQDTAGMEERVNHPEESSSDEQVTRPEKLRKGTLDIEAILPPAINSYLKPPPNPGWLLRKKTNSDEEELRPISAMNGTENYKLAIEIEHNPGIYQPFIAVLDSGAC
jgi:hypothetical protein